MKYEYLELVIAVTGSGAQFDLGSAAELEGEITQVLRGE